MCFKDEDRSNFNRSGEMRRGEKLCSQRGPGPTNRREKLQISFLSTTLLILVNLYLDGREAFSEVAVDFLPFSFSFFLFIPSEMENKIRKNYTNGEKKR